MSHNERLFGYDQLLLVHFSKVVKKQEGESKTNPDTSNDHGELANGHQKDVLGELADKLPHIQEGKIFGVALESWFSESFKHKMLKLAGASLLSSVFVPVSVFPFVFLWDFQSVGVLVIWPLVVACGYLVSTTMRTRVDEGQAKLMIEGLPFVLALCSVVFVGWGNFSALYTGHAKEALGGHLSMLAVGYPLLLISLILKLRWPEIRWFRYLIGVGALFCIPGFLRHLRAGGGLIQNGLFLGIHHLLFGLVLFVAVLCVLFVPSARQFSFVRSIERLIPHLVTLFLAWVPMQVVLIFLVAMANFGLGSVFLGVHALVVAFAYLGVLVVTAPPLVKKAVDYWEEKA